jgi:hypothetical protein
VASVTDSPSVGTRISAIEPPSNSHRSDQLVPAADVNSFDAPPT